jgi:hypothetical protein
VQITLHHFFHASGKPFYTLRRTGQNADTKTGCVQYTAYGLADKTGRTRDRNQPGHEYTTPIRRLQDKK